MTGRKCYDHLGGKLGAELLGFYLSQGWIELDEGKSTVYVITEKGYDGFKKIGLKIDRDNENDLACCGCICDGCKEFKKSCDGCNTVKGKPVWTTYAGLDKCPLYLCCVETKGLKNCGQCEKLPCEIFYQCIDPAMTKEQHEKTVQERVENLKKY